MNDEIVIQISAIGPTNIYGLTNKGNLARFDLELNTWVVIGKPSKIVDIYEANEAKKSEKVEKPIEETPVEEKPIEEKIDEAIDTLKASLQLNEDELSILHRGLV